jgi:glycosyltransferase involved in cell wall biosynthesis
MVHVDSIVFMVLRQVPSQVLAHLGYAMSDPKPRMCVLAATPLTIHFFLKPHIRELAKHFKVMLAFNSRNDPYTPPLNLPAQELAIPISRKIAPLSDLLTVFTLCRLFAREPFDIVVTVVPKAGLLGMVASWLMRVPRRVHIFQGEVWAAKRGPMRLLLKWIDTLTGRLATHLLAVSLSEKSFLEKEGVVPVGKVEVLGAGSICGVDTELFRADAAIRGRVRGELAIPEQAVVCLFLGRMTADKGVLDLLKAFTTSAATQANLWLLLVGPDEDQLGVRLGEFVPKEIAHRVRIAGFTQNPAEIMAASDFLCLPSYREGFGVVIIEAAAAGIPAIGTDVYGISDAIVNGHTGRIVPVGNVQALAEAIIRWCEHSEERARYGTAARDRMMRDFEQKIVIERYVKFFRAI